MATAAKAFILIECTIGRSKEVIATLKPLKGVISVNTVTGPYDVIAVIEGESLNEIGDIVTRQFQSVQGITRTVTCLVV